MALDFFLPHVWLGGRAELGPLLLLPAFAAMKIELCLFHKSRWPAETGASGALREGLAVSQHRGSLDSLRLAPSCPACTESSLA